jgi:uncharacterized tellurite resistance protein B-like protein
MGMFDRLSKSEPITLTPQAALLLAAVSITAADGDIDDDEIAIIRRLDGSGVTTDWELAMLAWKQSSYEECVALVAEALDDQQKIATIANLTDIAMADGSLADDEKDLLEEYVSAFGIQEEHLAAIVDVIELKNRRSIFL